MLHTGTKTIETERLLLRRITLNDAQMMFDNWASDSEVSRYMRWDTHKDVSESAEIIEKWFNRYESDSVYHWGICLKSGEMIGSLGIFSVDEHDERAEAGYCIGREFWNKGYTSEALSAVIAYMFSNTGINRIEAYHSVNNAASGKVMQKAGMRYEGFARQKYKSRDGYQDCYTYAVIRDDFK